MKFYLISDNIDTLMGLRLGGIEGIVVHEKHEVKEALGKALELKAPVWIECVIDREEAVLPMIPAGGSVDDMIIN